ncbi:cation transport regulator ChaC [Rhodanobacter sp. TND4EL1]
MIGVLAYGSLISDPGEELAAVIVGEKRDVLTPFHVEFARSSLKRCGAPTLVPVASGGRPVRAIIFEVSISAHEVLDIVYRREINAVSSRRKYVEPEPNKANTVRLDRFEKFEGFDVVISTRMSPNIERLSADVLADLAITSARELRDGRDGISYLLNAKACGIETELSAAYEQTILERTGAAGLAEALEAVRSCIP